MEQDSEKIEALSRPGWGVKSRKEGALVSLTAIPEDLLHIAEYHRVLLEIRKIGSQH